MGDGIQFRSHYNYDVKAASEEVGYVERLPSLTVQSMSEEADLNFLLKRFGVTGKMPDVVKIPQYGDFSEVGDFRSAMDAIIDAENNFMSLPADIRSKFQNDPQMLLDFASNPANIGELKTIFGEKNVPVRNDGTPAATANSPVGSAAPSGDGNPGGNAPGGK